MISLPLIGKICAWAGVILRVIAYQSSNSPHSCPEWVYDVDSLGFFLESAWPVCIAFSSGKRIYEFIVPSSLFAYVVMFDACKEITGVNQSKTGMEFILFWFFFLLTYLLSRHAREIRSGE